MGELQKNTPDKAKSYLFSVANNTTLNVIKHKKVVLNYELKATQKSSDHQDPSICFGGKRIYG